MKQTSIRPRAFFGFLPPSILLALVALVAFPTSSALARPKCSVVEFSYSYTGGGPLLVYMTSETPTPYTILFTTNGQDPTHNGSGTPTGGTAVYAGPYPIPYLQCRYIKALTFKAYPYVDSDITDYYICNPPQ
jgi:hypothetical protein